MVKYLTYFAFTEYNSSNHRESVKPRNLAYLSHFIHVFLCRLRDVYVYLLSRSLFQ